MPKGHMAAQLRAKENHPMNKATRHTLPAFIVLLLVSPPALRAADAPPTGKPNILVILSDDKY